MFSDTEEIDASYVQIILLLEINTVKRDVDAYQINVS
jgi:hypothetical protein